MKLRTCPACGSTDITADFSMGGLLLNRYKCKTCGYAGDIIIEQDVDKSFKK